MVGAALMFIFVVIGVPVLWLLVYIYGILREGREESFRVLRFISSLKISFSHFRRGGEFIQLIVIARKLVLTIIVGSLYGYPIYQYVIIGVAYFAEFILLLIIRPFRKIIITTIQVSL